MDGRENDDYIPDEGHLVSGKPRKAKHFEAGGPGGRPGQRGKNKREHGEKPVVTVKWNQPLTEQLWALIKAKPELKRVLVNEPTRFLGPHGAASQLFSKKDLQRTIAEHLFNDGLYDLTDQVIMDNLTRAVKNKLHKTQMLYESSLRDLPPEFVHYQSELEIPHSVRGRWAKVKDRFPTYFEYHELAQEIPTITAQMEIDAQQLGAWKAKALSGSEDGSPGSFLNTRHRSKSIETSASWDGPDIDSPSAPQHLLMPTLPDDQDFEVLPPPADQRAHLSDIESVGIPNATGLGGIGISPGLSPAISPSAEHPLNLQQSGRWSPNVHSPVMPLALSQPMVVNPMRGASNDNLPSNWSSMNDGRGSGHQGFEAGSYDANSILPGVWTTEPSTMPPHMNGGGSRYPAIPMSSVPQDGGHLTAQNSMQAQESRHSSVGIPLGHTKKRRRGHDRVPSGGGMSNGDYPPDSAAPSVSPQATSPYSATYSSTSGSLEPDSPRDDRAMEQLLQILKDREIRKQRKQEEWVNHKKRKFDDRERQRQENQNQREENERQRQHEQMLMDQKLQLAQLEVQRRRYASDSMRSSSVTGSGMASPDHLSHEPMSGYPHDNQPHDLQYPDNMMLFSGMPPNQGNFDQHSLAMMGMAGSSHTPIPGGSMAMGQTLQQQGGGQQKGRMGMMGMGQFQQEQYHDPGLEELLAGTMHGHQGQG